jgi:hypothetical protein
MRLHHRVIAGGRDIARRTGAWLCKAWASHGTLLRTNRAYESAIAAAAVNLITQTRWDRLLAAVITGLLDIYAAIRRATGRREDPELYGWDMS